MYFWKSVISKQFGATIDMLENAMQQWLFQHSDILIEAIAEAVARNQSCVNPVCGLTNSKPERL